MLRHDANVPPWPQFSAYVVFRAHPVSIALNLHRNSPDELGECVIVLLAYGAPSGGLIDIPISFFPKNKLHLKAHEVAEFRLVAAIPPLPTSTLEIGA